MPRVIATCSRVANVATTPRYLKLRISCCCCRQCCCCCCCCCYYCCCCCCCCDSRTRFTLFAVVFIASVKTISCRSPPPSQKPHSPCVVSAILATGFTRQSLHNFCHMPFNAHCSCCYAACCCCCSCCCFCCCCGQQLWSFFIWIDFQSFQGVYKLGSYWLRIANTNQI